MSVDAQRLNRGVAEVPRRLTVFLAFAQDYVRPDQYLRNLAREQRGIRNALQPAFDAGLCTPLERSNATASDVFDAFQNHAHNGIALFHFGGHAGSAELLLESDAGEPETAHAAGLAAFLAEQRSLALVFLNGCSSQGQVDGLLRAGVAAVIATSEDIWDDIATDFAIRFYTGLAGGATLRSAFAQAEAAARATLGDQARAALQDSDAAAIADGDWPWRLHTQPGAGESAKDWSLTEASRQPLYGLPPLPHDELPPQPFKHLHRFERKDAWLFFGRGRDIRRIYEALTDLTAAPIVLLFGVTGVGKSSLLDAGLHPRLANTHEVRYQRHERERGLAGTLALALGASDTESPTQAWLRQETAGRPLIVILDQIEEAWVPPNARGDDHDFSRQLSNLFPADSTRPKGRLLLSFRKEWLADVLRMLDIDALPRTLYELAHLDRVGVIEAITGPALQPRLHDRYHLSVEPGLAETIAEDLLADTDSSIAPTLQILLTKLWARAYETNPAAPVFSTADYQKLRRSGLLLDDFISEQFALLHSADAKAIESGLLLDLLHHHTTSLGSGKPRTRAELQERYGDRPGLPGLVDGCIRGYLLLDSKVSATGDARETQGLTTSTRLAHDTLAPLIRSRHDHSLLPAQRATRILEQRAREWERGRVGAPLDAFDLRLVESGAAGMRRFSEAEQRLVTASVDAQRKRRRNRVALTVGGITAGALIIMTSLYAWLLTFEARAAQARSRDRAIAAIAADIADPTDRLLHLLEIDQLETTPTAQTQLHQVLNLSVAACNFSDVSLAIFNPAGDRLLTVSEQSVARLWDIHDCGTPLQTFPALWSPVVSAAFNSTGDRVLVTSAGYARLWDIENGERPLRKFALSELESFLSDVIPNSDVRTCHFADGQLWSLDSGSALRAFSGIADTVINAVCDSAGKHVLTVSYGGPAHLWEIDSDDPPLRTIALPKGQIVSATISPAGQQVLTVSDGGIVHVWGITGGDTPPRSIESPGGPIRSAVFSADGNRVLTVSDDDARLWDSTRASAVQQVFVKPETELRSAHFNAAGDRVVTAYKDGTVYLWDIGKPDPIQIYSAPRYEVDSAIFKLLANPTMAAVFNAAGDHVLAVSANGTARLWEINNRATALQTFLGHQKPATAAVFNTAGNRVLTASEDGTARLWDVNDGKKSLRTFTGHEGPVGFAVFNAAGDRLLTGGRYDETVHLWDVDDGNTPLRTFIGHSGYVSYGAFNAAGDRLLTVHTNGTLLLWDIDNDDKPLRTFEGSQRAVRFAVFDATGDRILAAYDDGTTSLWDIKNSGRPPTVFTGHDGMISTAMFNAEGNRVVTTGRLDGAVRLWDVDNAHWPLQTFTGSRGGAVSAVFGCAGNRVLAAHNDGTAWIWNTDNSDTPLRTFSLGENRFQSAMFNPAGDSLLTTTTWNGRVQLWPAAGELVKAVARSRTRDCLDIKSLTNAFGEQPREAEQRRAACVACVPVFFNALDSFPNGDTRRYGHAWGQYRQCLGQHKN